jgi:hypothetical protein
MGDYIQILDINYIDIYTIKRQIEKYCLRDLFGSREIMDGNSESAGDRWGIICGDPPKELGG